MSLQSFTTWLYATPLSTQIRDVSWLVPAVQSVHILAITVILGSALVLDLRIAGVLATDTSVRTVVQRYLPWTWIALAVLLLTGSIMAIGEPDRVLHNTTFWLKMILVLVGLGVTWLVTQPVLSPKFDVESRWWRFGAKPAAWLSLVLWIVIIFFGRWIAYS